MSLYRDPKSPNWYIDVERGGQRVRRSSGTADRREAQALHDEIAAGLSAGKSRGSLRRWKDAAAAWLKAGERGESDRWRLQALDWHRTNPPLAAIDSDAIRAALAGKSPGSANRYCNLIRAILQIAEDARWIDRVPVMPRAKEPPGRVRWLTRQEWKRLEAELPDHLLPLARFSIATGLRQHNATHLTWEQVDLRRAVAWVHPDEAKARKAIGVPLSKAAVAVLRAQRRPRAGYEPHETWVFPYRGSPLAKIKGAFTRACERAGIEDFTWHGLRHTWATWHVMSGTPLAVLQQLGGWATYSMVLRYSHFAPDHLAGYADNARPIAAGRAA